MKEQGETEEKGGGKEKRSLPLATDRQAIGREAVRGKKLAELARIKLKKKAKSPGTAGRGNRARAFLFDPILKFLFKCWCK